MQTVTLSVDDVVKSLGDALKILAGDIMAKKTTAQIVSDALPGLMTAIGGFQEMGADLKKVDNQIYLAKCLAEAFEPTPTA